MNPTNPKQIELLAAMLPDMDETKLNKIAAIMLGVTVVPEEETVDLPPVKAAAERVRLRKPRKRDATKLSSRLRKVMITKRQGATPDEVYADFQAAQICYASDSPVVIRKQLKQSTNTYQQMGTEERWIYRWFDRLDARAAKQQAAGAAA